MNKSSNFSIALNKNSGVTKSFGSQNVPEDGAFMLMRPRHRQLEKKMTRYNRTTRFKTLFILLSFTERSNSIYTNVKTSLLTGSIL